MAQKLSPQEQLMATYITLNVICASLDIFWIYAGKTNEKHLPEHVLNSFQRFIVFDREAHFRTAIVTLLTLFDTTRSTVTLDRMIKGAAIDHAKRQKLLRFLERLLPRIGKIQALRHNLYAHRSHTAVHNKIFAGAQLTRNDLEIVVKAAIRIVNTLAVEMCGPLYVRNRDARDELLRLLASAHV